MAYLQNMADVLRRAGLQVVEIEGWKTRGRTNNSQYVSGRPWCIMWHHTASGGVGASDARYCATGSAIAPVCNIVVGREGICYVCAAGPSNTNGKGNAMRFSKGTVPKDQMNTHAIGMEISNNGVGMAYPQVQVDAAFKASNALAAAYGLRPDDVANHADYSPGRKIDCATAAAPQGPWKPRSTNSSGTWNLADLRAECNRRASAGPGPTPPIPPGTTFLDLGDFRMTDERRIYDSRRDDDKQPANMFAVKTGVDPNTHSAVFCNVTAIAGSESGFMGVGTETSFNNFQPGQVVDNARPFKLNSDGSISLGTSGPAIHILVDLIGVYPK